MIFSFSGKSSHFYIYKTRTICANNALFPIVSLGKFFHRRHIRITDGYRSVYTAPKSCRINL